jgi:hypothetical protein
MKRVRILALPLVLAALIQAPALAGDASSERYGAPVTVRKATDLAKVSKAPQKFEGKTLKLEGVVADVCQGRGCWIEITTAKGATFLAKSLDETVLVPKDCKGRKVTVQGVITALPAKEDEHHGEEGHSCPTPSYVLATSGVELAKK